MYAGHMTSHTKKVIILGVWQRQQLETSHRGNLKANRGECHHALSQPESHCTCWFKNSLQAMTFPGPNQRLDVFVLVINRKRSKKM